MGKHKGEGNRYVMYLRCSTDDQKFGDFTTIDAQRDINTRQIQELKGVLVGEYVDEGRTGTNLKRPDFRRLLSDAQAGKFDKICITYMSRLARGDVYHVAEYLLEEASVQVVMVKEHFTNDLTGYMNKSFKVLIDGVYPKQVSEWTKTKMHEMVMKGYDCGGLLILGYLREIVPSANIARSADKEPPKRLVPDPETKDIVKCAFDIYLEKRSLAAVRSYLSAACNRNFTTTTIKNMLMNEKYIGINHWGNVRNEQAHEAIVNRAIFLAVQQALGEFSPRQANGESDFTYYLRGRLRCPHCDCPYTHLSVNRASANRQKRIHYYVCSKANKHKSTCPVVRINAEALHFTVLHEMQRATEHNTVMQRLISQSGGWGAAHQAQKALRGQLAKKKQFLQVQIGNITNAIANGGNMKSLLVTLERLEGEQADISLQFDAIDKEIAVATIKRPTAEQVQQVWGQVVNLWDHMTEEERTTALGGLVQSIDVKEKDRVLLQFVPIAEVHGQLLALKSNLGAGVGLEPTTFGL